MYICLLKCALIYYYVVVNNYIENKIKYLLYNTLSDIFLSFISNKGLFII